MPRIATRHPDQLAFRQRFSVALRMFGCLVLLAGSMVVAATISAAMEETMTGRLWLMVVIGLLLIVCGAVLLAGERGKLIDREKRTVTDWWGIVRPLWHRTWSVHSHQVVAVEHDQAQGIARWRVTLYSPEAEPLQLFDLASHSAADGAARQVAAFLSLSIVAAGKAGGNA
jgi:hypothetical protein